LVVRGGRRLGFEFKLTDTPAVTTSMKIAMETLRLGEINVIHASRRTFRPASGIRALAARDLLREMKPIRP
jgi:hypothetical protein